MPIRQSQARLWFKTKEEIDEYDDKMISSIELKSNDIDDDNYSPVFQRSKKEFVLKLSQKAAQQATSIAGILTHNRKTFVDKYFGGKNDNTAYRQWSIHKIGLTYMGGYLLLRQLPIRNFYARSFIMFVFIAKMAETYTVPLSLTGIISAVPDVWTAKDIRNYGTFNDSRVQVIPNNNNKLNEGRLWKLSQPGYLRYTPERAALTAHQVIFSPEKKTVAWDGTWNMPLAGLAHPLHKDAKYFDFITQ